MNYLSSSKESMNKMFSTWKSGVLDRNSSTFKYTIALLVVMIIAIIIYAVLQYREYDRLNPRFLRGGHITTKPEKIVAKNLPLSINGYECTYNAWIYIKNMDYLFGKWKHVFTKGNVGMTEEQQCPSVWIHPTINNLRIFVKTPSELEYVDVEDIPIKKWFSLSIVMNNQILEIYINGLLQNTKALKGSVVMNGGDLHLSNQGGFEGVVSNVSYHIEIQSAKNIQSMYTGGPWGRNIFEALYNNMFGNKKLILEYINKE